MTIYPLYLIPALISALLIIYLAPFKSKRANEFAGAVFATIFFLWFGVERLHITVVCPPNIGARQ